MNRLRYLLLAAVSLIVPANTVWSAPVPSARSALEQVPATTPLLVHVRGVQGVHDRLVALMKQALPDLLNKYQTQIDDFFEKGPDNALKGRKLRGLAKDGPIFFALLELPKPNDPGEPKMAYIFTVTDYKEFRNSLLKEEERKNIKDEGNGIESASFESSKTIYFVERKGYAVLTPDKEAAESFTKKITGLSTKINKELAAKLLSSDLGIYVNMDAVNKEYSDLIKQIKQGAEQGLAFAAAGDESQKKFAEMAKKALDPIFQSIEDMQSLLLSFELRSSGLALNLQGEMKEGSPTGTLLQDSRPVDFEELGRLPRDRAFYLGVKGSASLYQNLGSFLSTLGSGAQDYESLMKETAKAGPNIMLISGTFPSSGLDVTHFDDPAKVVDAYLKMYRSMDPAANNFKGKPVVKADAEKFGDIKFHSVQIDMDLDKMAEQAAAKGGDESKKQIAEAMKSIIGEKRNLWFGVDGKTLLQVTAPDWKTASKMLEQYTKGGAANEVPGFRDVRKEMPKQTSILALVDSVRLFGKIIEATKPMFPGGAQLPPGWPNMPGKGTAGYVGLSVTLQPQRGGFDLFISAAAAREFYKAVVQPLLGE